MAWRGRGNSEQEAFLLLAVWPLSPLPLTEESRANGDETSSRLRIQNRPFCSLHFLQRGHKERQGVWERWAWSIWERNQESMSPKGAGRHFPWVSLLPGHCLGESRQLVAVPGGRARLPSSLRGCEEGRPVTVRPLSVFLLSKRRDASISKTYSLLTKPPLGLYPVSCALSSGNSMARKRKFSLGQTNA